MTITVATTKNFNLFGDRNKAIGEESPPGDIINFPKEQKMPPGYKKPLVESPEYATQQTHKT